MKRVYRGKKDAKGFPTPVRVELLDDDGVVRRTFPLNHHEIHSPDGFNWGYGGSGPADLAYAILLDCLRRTCSTQVAKAAANDLYQRFKAQTVANLPDSFEVDAESVERWIAEHYNFERSEVKGY